MWSYFLIKVTIRVALAVFRSSCSLALSDAQEVRKVMNCNSLELAIETCIRISVHFSSSYLLI